MDPDATLKRIREIIETYDDSVPSQVFKASELVNLVAGMDDWLSQDGHYPTAWDGHEKDTAIQSYNAGASESWYDS